jgi:hypothetical protein
MHCNVTSIKKHKDEIYARFNNYDILSINETNLKPQHNLSLPGYNIFRNDRVDKQGGDVLLAIGNNIKCHEIFNETRENNETVAVQVETSHGIPLVALIYIPPNVKLQQDLFEHLYNLNNNCLIMGDLNAALQSILQCIDNNLTMYERNNYEEKLDWILASQPTIFFINEVETQPSLGLKEDHKPIVFNLNMSADYKPASPRPSFNFNEADWKSYRNKLNDLLNKIDIDVKITTAQQIETYATLLTESIVTATRSSIPIKNGTLTSSKISNVTKKLIESKHQAYRQWRKANNENDKKEYYNRRALLANSLRNDRIERLKQIMMSLSPRKMHSSKVWATVRKYHNKRTKQQHSGDLIYEDIVARTYQDEANLFALYFQKEVFVEKPNHLPFHEQIILIISD